MKHDNQLFRTLVSQHREVDEMLTQLQGGDHDSRRTLFPQMRLALLSHAKAEEKTFYAALERAGEKRDAKHAKREHREIEDAMRELDALDYSDDGWTKAVTKLADAVEHHVEEEESEIFDAAADSMETAELDELAQRFLEQQEAEKARLGAADDYEERTKDELLELARTHEIEGRSTMTKAELIAALRLHS
jgi:hypothetical protein